MEFSKMCYEIRRRKGLSQEEVAQQLKVSRQTISKWENGETVPDLEKLVTLAEVFEISLDELVLGHKSTVYQETSYEQNTISAESEKEKETAFDPYMVSLTLSFLGALILMLESSGILPEWCTLIGYASQLVSIMVLLNQPKFKNLGEKKILRYWQLQTISLMIGSGRLLGELLRSTTYFGSFWHHQRGLHWVLNRMSVLMTYLFLVILVEIILYIMAKRKHSTASL